MSSTYTFSCPVVHGLHARPASQLAELAKRFAAAVTLTNERTGASANAKSILAIVSADVRVDDPCRLDVRGDGADAALDALRDLVSNELVSGGGEPGDESKSTDMALPRSFLETNADWRAGTPVSGGIGRGTAVRVAVLGLPDTVADTAAGSPAEEIARFQGALGRVRNHLSALQATTSDDPRSGILTAHLGIVDDVDLRAQVEEHIGAGCSAAHAVAEVARSFSHRLQAADSVYIRERAVDVEDIGLQILEALGGKDLADAKIELRVPSVVVAENLTPRQLLSADRGLIRALVLEHAGTTAHVVILARSMGIPTLTGVVGARTSLAEGDEVIVDAYLGVVVSNLRPAVTRYYEREQDMRRRRQERITRAAKHDAATSDGRGLEVGVNVGIRDDIAADSLALADGIGLLRTEVVFSDRESAPTEDEQYEVYAKAVATAGGKAVIIRMFDVGADKPLPYFPLPTEENPFLGCRGVRNYSRHKDLIQAQLRAIIRASETGPVRLMVPMVSCLEEITFLRGQMAAAQEELRSAGIQFDPAMQIGIMVEVPLITHALDEVCEVVDFLSIGTNDLAQYFAAADRCNPTVARLGDVRHPAFLRVLESIVRTAHRHGRWVGMCGDMASDVGNLPLLIGLEIDEISVIAPEVARIKVAVGRHSAAVCKALFDAARSCRTATEVEQLLDELPSGGVAEGMLSPELAVVGVDCASKAEAIRVLVDELFVAGRTDEPERVEEAVWAREGISTTGLGHGFAIPHCKCDGVSTSSVAVARLSRPIDWGSVDGAPVECVILLAMSEADQQDTHMRVFSTLARRLMHEEFREGLQTADDAAGLHAFLSTELASATR